MIRCTLQLPQDILDVIDAARPAGQSRAEWIREAIRAKLEAEHKTKGADHVL